MKLLTFLLCIPFFINAQVNLKLLDENQYLNIKSYYKGEENIPLGHDSHEDSWMFKIGKGNFQSYLELCEIGNNYQLRIHNDTIKVKLFNKEEIILNVLSLSDSIMTTQWDNDNYIDYWVNVKYRNTNKPNCNNAVGEHDKVNELPTYPSICF